MEEKEQIELVNRIIAEIGEEKDRSAYMRIAKAWHMDLQVIHDALTEAQERLKGKPLQIVRRYFMKMVKNLSKGYKVEVFQKWTDEWK